MIGTGATPPPLAPAPPRRQRRQISAEWLAYLLLALVVLLLRTAELGRMPLSDAEARMALHAWHTVEDDAPGQFTLSNSPSLHIAQVLAFSVAGASEMSARIGAALAGFALVFTPLLFRSSLGLTRTFVCAVLLALLTTPLAASRQADGTSFVVLYAVLAVWMIRRYWYSQRLAHACLAVAFVTAMALLASPSGLLLLLILPLAGWLAAWRTALSAPQRLGLPGDDILQQAGQIVRTFPYSKVIFVPFLLLVLGGTLFMLHPAGLYTVSRLIETALYGLRHSATPDGLRYGFLALLLHEPLLILCASGGAWLLWRHGEVTFVDRFAAAWALLGALALLLYPGAGPADALWVLVPLTLLASYGITQLMVNRRVIVLWTQLGDDAEAHDSAPLYSTHFWWVKWVLSVAFLGSFLTLTLQGLGLARDLQSVPVGTSLSAALALLGDPAYSGLAATAVYMFIILVITVVLFLLLANIWGLRTCLQGLGLCVLWAMLLLGLGGGWQASAADIGMPSGVWRASAVTEDASLLRTSLLEVAQRESGGFPSLPVLVASNSPPMRDDGLVAWLLRDFRRARFVPVSAVPEQAPIVLLESPELAGERLQGNYVGQRFLLRRSLPLGDVLVWDLPGWWTQELPGRQPIQEEAVILWLRQDVYDGLASDLDLRV